MPCTCNCRGLSHTHEHILRHSGSANEPSTAAQHVSLNTAIDLTKTVFYNVCENQTDALRVFDPEFICATTTQGSSQALGGVTSDADEEILVMVYFSDFIRLKGINIVAPGGPQSPAAIKLFANRGAEVTGFDSVRRLVAEQNFNLVDGYEATKDLLYLLDSHKFSNVANIALLFDANYGADETNILRIEFFGESTGQSVNKKLATNVVYDSGRNPADYQEYLTYDKDVQVGM